MRNSPVRRLSWLLVLLAGMAALPGCGLVWWGAAGGAGWYFYSDSVEEDDEDSAPVILSISSTTGEEIGGQTVTINGELFENGARVFFGATEATSVTFISAFMIQVVTPAVSTGAAGTLTVDVEVENPDGQKSTLASAYSYVDNISPAQVPDLTATPGNTDEVVLAFTAVGDNGTLGQAASYDLRWDSSPINEASWATAQTDHTWPTAPQMSGLPESWNLTKTWATFYFALKVTDDAGNVSAISNSVQFDPFAPDAATGLNAYPGTQRGRVILSWMTTADDGSTGASGPVSAYQIRYARAPILDETMFAAAADV
ncbi:MAG: IPT/TIG domain-containing protein, partial [Planctomycetota bacterium]